MKISGKLVYAPELRFTPSGKALCTFQIDTGESFANCEAWEELGERIVERDLQPQRSIEVSGYYTTRT